MHSQRRARAPPTRTHSRAHSRTRSTACALMPTQKHVEQARALRGGRRCERTACRVVSRRRGPSVGKVGADRGLRRNIQRGRLSRRHINHTYTETLVHTTPCTPHARTGPCPSPEPVAKPTNVIGAPVGRTSSCTSATRARARRCRAHTTHTHTHTTHTHHHHHGLLQRAHFSLHSPALSMQLAANQRHKTVVESHNNLN